MTNPPFPFLAVSKRGKAAAPPPPPAEPAAATAAAGDAATALPPGKVYQDYHPLLLAQMQGPGDEVLTFSSFDAALDEFYSKVGALAGCVCAWMARGREALWGGGTRADAEARGQASGLSQL